MLRETPSIEPAPSVFEDFLRRQQGQELLRLVICGSGEVGKSTLVGWLLDELATGQEQVSTLDVAYRFFATARRKFIVADTPGHEQATRNMLTGASTAGVAVLLVDARQGLLAQTRRHACLVSLMGIRHVALAVNKMDLVEFNADVFNEISESFRQFAAPLGFESITPIPLSALRGDNIAEPSANLPWHAGPTLMGFLETVRITPAAVGSLAFPVQWVNRADENGRGLSGSVVRGCVRVGDEIRITASGQTATVEKIVTMEGDLEQAQAGDAVTLTLGREIDAARGDVLSHAQNPLQTTDQFEAELVWLNEEPGLIGRTYDIKLATQWASASITAIKHRVDVDTLAHEAARTLMLNDICLCNLSTGKPLVFDSYADSRVLGSFILVDRLSHATVAAGMISHSLRRAQNVHRQALSISRPERERLNSHRGRVIWFTGLSGSGKSTIANALEVEFHALGRRTYVLDGDNVRQGLNKDLGFTDADRVENIRRIAEVARLMLDAGLIVMTAFISPFGRERQMAREVIGAENFFEVHVSTPLEVCEQRDVKGLYKKARSGALPNMTGVGSAYEAPEHADFVLDCSDEPVAQGVRRLIEALDR